MGEVGSSGKRRKKTPRNIATLTNSDNLDTANSDKKMNKVARNKKRKGTELPVAETTDINEIQHSPGMSDKKTNKLKKKKRNKENRKEGVCDDVLHSNEARDDSNQQSDKMDAAISDKKKKKVARNKKRIATELPKSETPEIKKRNKLKKKKKDKENGKKVGVREHVSHTNEADQQRGKSKSASQTENDNTLFDDEDEVYQMSSGDEDETTGMKRWITKYHRARPGADVLLENINDFLVDYWAQKEMEKKEKENEAAEGGWTVVTHIKGRKKTTDAESGTTVGSVAQAAVMDKMSKKKNNQVGINFYRFQRREAQRNEIMTLQSKFEQDKKRIQQMRAARKFRPY